MKRYFGLLLIVSIFIASTVYAGIESTIGGIGTAKNYRWKVEDGDIVPADDSSYDIGETDAEVQAIYADAIILGGVSKASWGSVVSPFEDDGTTTTLTSAPTKFILTHATGVSSFTGYIAGTGDVVLENGQKIDGGTNNGILLTENSDTLSFTYSGNDIVVDSTDGGIMFTLTDASDGTVDIMANNDADDYIQFSTTTNQPLINFVGCDGSITAAGGDISFGDDNLVTTGTLGAGASSLGAVTATSFIISDDTLDVVVDDQLRFASNDEESTIEAYGFEAKNGVIQLTADEGDDAGDKIQLVSDQATNSLLFTSDTAVKDTHATILTLAKTGIITTTGDVQVVNDSATTDAVQDVLKLTSSSSGTAAAGLGVGIVLHVEDLGGIEEQASIDVALTDETDGAEYADVVVSQNTAGAIAETLRLVAASSATVSDYLQFTANTTETNAATNVLVLKTATGTAADNYGMSISFQPEDATGSEEVASLDIIQTTAARATNDTDFVFSQNVAGAIEERVRFDADDDTILLTGTSPKMTIGDAGAEDTALNFDGNAQDFHVGLDDTADDLVIGVGSALGTTTAISIDENTDVSVSGNLTTEGALDIGTVETFTDSDLTPDVSDGSYFITNTTTATLTDFDGAGIVDGQVIYVESAGAITYDVTTTGLIGGSTDIVTADGDLTSWLYNGTDWLLISFMDLSDDMS